MDSLHRTGQSSRMKRMGSRAPQPCVFRTILTDEVAGLFIIQLPDWCRNWSISFRPPMAIDLRRVTSSPLKLVPPTFPSPPHFLRWSANFDLLLKTPKTLQKKQKKNNYFLIPKESWRNGGLDGATPNCTAAHQHRNKQINQTAAAALKYQQEPRRNAELRQQFIGQNWTTGRHRQFQLFASPKSRETVRVTAPLTIT